MTHSLTAITREGEFPLGPSLTAPANFNASGGDTLVNLSWNSVSGATDYEIRVDSGSWVSTSNATTYQVTSLTNDQSYLFEVRATSAEEDGPVSSDSATPSESASGARFVVAPETEADYFVSSTGSNGNAGTSEGAAFATLTHAVNNSAAGDKIMIVDDITESFEASVFTLNPGTSGARREVVGKNANTKIIGEIQNATYTPAVSTYTDFKNIFFEASSSSEPNLEPLTDCSFFRCMFTGGQTSGNVSKLSVGSSQTFEQCAFFGSGGRYTMLCYQQSNTVFRHCLGRVDAGWTGSSEPNGNMQIYSSTDVSMIQCVGFDWQQRDASSEYLGEIINTTNEGASSGVIIDNCYVVDGGASGYQCEGSGAIGIIYRNSVSLRNGGGITENCQGGGTAELDGGEYSNNTGDGASSYGSATTSMSNSPNFVGNAVEQVRYWNGTFTSNALSLPMPKVVGDLLAGQGDVAEFTAQTEDLFTASGEFLSADVQVMFKAAMEPTRSWSQANLGDIIGVTP